MFEDPENPDLTIFVLKNEEGKEGRITNEDLYLEPVGNPAEFKNINPVITSKFSPGTRVIRSQKGVILLPPEPPTGKG